MERQGFIIRSKLLTTTKMKRKLVFKIREKKTQISLHGVLEIVVWFTLAERPDAPKTRTSLNMRFQVVSLTLS